MKSIGIIPARYASSRFPAKALAQIAGKSLIQRTYERASLCKELSKIVVATDDNRILEHVLGFGGEAVMTSVSCVNGTERIFEVVSRHKKYADFDVVVNIQGDEPCLDPTIISKLLNKLMSDPKAVVATPICLIQNEEDYNNPSVVKCVKNMHDRALYFSRSPIPHLAKNSQVKSIDVFRHVGLYAYQKEFLSHYAHLPNTPLQLAEELEQLKILEHGYPIAVVIVEHSGIDVNEPSDIQKVEKYLWQQNSSS
jgi:3-deoxy-manno-octulosonate cytidylyltransferase (CMP-KDO synthetase)